MKEDEGGFTRVQQPGGTTRLRTAGQPGAFTRCRAKN